MQIKAPALPGLFLCGIGGNHCESAPCRSAPGRERTTENARRAQVRSYEAAMSAGCSDRREGLNNHGK
ncbi:hypothetical protein Q6A38_08720 [Xanthomonas euvesicatoria pv. eucalypti]|uniref:hypothetical protein n=1 Tax=Xanthomonas euvesicatoria TaxID=456327 RepID=UPI0026E13555|nr:hypothetical protein [Xanthomonas euvesicatoria]MDO7941828.1 hypothetical protein [Xanthomonas euvesicatoria pv. eucalypti]MDO7944745.1 hypothetical protein [Xanthomonas euvesicatoria pv. eucalypti]